jgi:hypothetical protein
MPCKHVRVSGKKFRVVSIKKTKRLPRGSKILIPSSGGTMRRRKRKAHHKARRVRVHGFTRKVHGRRVRVHGYMRKR